jgi:hypothetical protein
MQDCCELVEALARWLHERRVELARRQGVHIFETTWSQVHPETKLLLQLLAGELLPLLTELPRPCGPSPPCRAGPGELRPADREGIPGPADRRRPSSRLTGTARTRHRTKG